MTFEQHGCRYQSKLYTACMYYTYCWNGLMQWRVTGDFKWHFVYIYISLCIWFFGFKWVQKENCCARGWASATDNQLVMLFNSCFLKKYIIINLYKIYGYTIMTWIIVSMNDTWGMNLKAILETLVVPDISYSIFEFPLYTHVLALLNTLSLLLIASTKF